ncbi:MAG: hypothetical protein ACI85I_001442, partial [Arenicella sp.]
KSPLLSKRKAGKTKTTKNTILNIFIPICFNSKKLIGNKFLTRKQYEQIGSMKHVMLLKT